MKGKKLFSVILICALILSVIFSSTDVSAQSKNFLKVAYKGKTVTLFNGQKRISLKTVQKAWGKGKKISHNTYAWYTYRWKTKKTKIEIAGDPSSGKTGGINISIEDKNGSMAGVKVGMTKAQALKILEKKYGSRNIKIIKTTSGSFIRIDTLGMNSFSIKSGKIVKMGYYCS